MREVRIDPRFVRAARVLDDAKGFVVKRLDVELREALPIFAPHEPRLPKGGVARKGRRRLAPLGRHGYAPADEIDPSRNEVRKEGLPGGRAKPDPSRKACALGKKREKLRVVPDYAPLGVAQRKRNEVPGDPDAQRHRVGVRGKVDVLIRATRGADVGDIAKSVALDVSGLFRGGVRGVGACGGRGNTRRSAHGENEGKVEGCRKVERFWFFQSSSNASVTGAWSEGCAFARGRASTALDFTRARSASETSSRSMRSPRFFSNPAWR